MSDTLTPPPDLRLEADLRDVADLVRGHLLTDGAQFFVQLVADAVLDLWKYLDAADTDTGPTWARPELELQYAAAWDWEADTLAEYTDPAAVTLEAVTAAALALFTRGAFLRLDGATEGRLVPADLLEQFPATSVDAPVWDHVDTPEGRAFAARYTPLPLTAPVLVALARPEKEVSYFLALDRAAVTPAPDLVRASGDVQGSRCEARLRVNVHPLVVETQTRRAYFPVVLAITYTGDVPLTAWSETERATLRETFHHGLMEVLHLLEGDPGPVTGTADVVLDGLTLTATGTVFSPTAPPEHVGPPPAERRVFPLPVGLTKVDAGVLDLLGAVHKVRLPVSRWNSLKSWPELVEEEKARLLEEEGDRAFVQLPQGRGPLLTRRAKGRETVIRLTDEAENQLKIRKGLGAGFRYLEPRTGREYLSRVFEFRSGYLEVGLSWFGMAGPWVDEWRRGVQKEVETEAAQTSLFHELDEAVQARVRRVRLLGDSYRLMEAVLGQVGRQRQNPVVVPAEAFRVLPELRTDPNWKARLEDGLDALRACEFRFRSFDTAEHKGYGAFLGAWTYRAAGPGSHGDGAYLLWVTPPFLGCLTIFESGKRAIGDSFVTTFDFMRAIPEDDKAALGWGYDRKAHRPRKARAWFVEFDAGRPFYSAVAGLTPTQEALLRFLDANITRRSSPVSRKLGAYGARKADQLPRQAAEGAHPRVYTSAVCPLVPAGRRYVAALGNRTRVPEGGWTLYGTARREGKTGGPHTPGLLPVMGYSLPLGSGSQARARADVVQKALGDLRAVVEEYLGGVVAARHAGHWLTLEEAATLQDDDLGRRTHWFLFVPETYHADRREKFERATGYTLTEDLEEARRAALGELGAAGLPLRERLRMTRLERGLSQAAVGHLFGVSHRAVGGWEIGPEPDEHGKVRGKPIPRELVPLMERWIVGGPPPTVEELRGRKTSRTGGRKP